MGTRCVLETWPDFLPIFPALFFLLELTYFSRNYAGRLGAGLHHTSHVAYLEYRGVCILEASSTVPVGMARHTCTVECYESACDPELSLAVHW